MQPVMFEKWGMFLVGWLKVGYAQDYGLEYKPISLDSKFEFKASPKQGNISSAPIEEQQPLTEDQEDLKLQSTIEFDWVTIPAGEFTYGYLDINKMIYLRILRDVEWGSHLLRRRRIYLPEYSISRYPVTNAQYKFFVDATNYETPEHWEGGRIPSGKQNHPVVHVSWDDALSFCLWAGVYLPTEEQWEKAARGTDGRTYPWGNEEPNEAVGNFSEDMQDTTPVGHQSPQGDSPYGVADMAGNVREWTASQYRENYHTYYLARVIRGSMFGAPPKIDTIIRYCTYSAYRDSTRPHNRNLYYVGFRVVSSP